MSKTFSPQDAVHFSIVQHDTYDNGVASLDDFLYHHKIPSAKGYKSAYIQEPEFSDEDILINVEAYDDDFYDVTRTDGKRDRFKEQLHNRLKKLFPDARIRVLWYSGFDYHKTFYL